MTSLIFAFLAGGHFTVALFAFGLNGLRWQTPFCIVLGSLCIALAALAA